MLIFRLAVVVLSIAVVAGLFGFGVLESSRPTIGRLLFVLGLTTAGALGVLGIYARQAAR